MNEAIGNCLQAHLNRKYRLGNFISKRSFFSYLKLVIGFNQIPAFEAPYF